MACPTPCGHASTRIDSGLYSDCRPQHQLRLHETFFNNIHRYQLASKGLYFSWLLLCAVTCFCFFACSMPKHILYSMLPDFVFLFCDNQAGAMIHLSHFSCLLKSQDLGLCLLAWSHLWSLHLFCVFASSAGAATLTGLA